MYDVSVVIPVYNSENTIERALLSVTSQTYKNLEVIVINDGSKDNSSEIIKNFIKSNTEYDIKYFYQENSGVSIARNRGVELSTGRYIAFLDSDDSWEPQKIAKQMELIRRHDIDMLGSNIYVCLDNEKLHKYFTKEALYKVDFYKHLFKHYYNTPTVVIKKRCLAEMRWISGKPAICRGFTSMVQGFQRLQQLYNQ